MTKHIKSVVVEVITDGKACDPECPFFVIVDGEEECRLFDCALYPSGRGLGCLEIFKEDDE